MLGARPSPLPAVAAAVLLAFTATLAAAADPAIRLVVRGDDMGSSQASNEASIRCFRDGVMRDVELMAVGPWFPEAARLLRENPGLDVGLHLALTSEWDNVKWRPLTTAPSLAGRDGYFHPMIWPHPHYGKERALKEQPWKLDEIERELRAQIELTRREVPHLSHLSDHMGFQALGPEIAALVKRLAGENGLDVDPGGLGARWVGWDGMPSTPEEKVASFARVLEKLEPGTWIFVDHPALDTPEMRAIGHVGYENVAVDRQGVTDAWTSPAAKAIVERRGIELVGYRDLAREASSRVPTRAERGSTWANDVPFASGRVECAVLESPCERRALAGTPADGSRGIRGTADPSTPVGAEASRDDGGENAASAIDGRGNR